MCKTHYWFLNYNLLIHLHLNYTFVPTSVILYVKKNMYNVIHFKNCSTYTIYNISPPILNL